MAAAETTIRFPSGCHVAESMYWNGVVFTMQADGSHYSVLHHFAAANGNAFTNADGAIPKAGLVRSEGCLYGFTVYGGAYGYGTLFRLSISPRLEIDNYDLRLFGYSNQVVVLESCTDLSLPVWVTVQTNTITGGSLSLPYAADGSNRFFRLVLP